MTENPTFDQLDNDQFDDDLTDDDQSNQDSVSPLEVVPSCGLSALHELAEDHEPCPSCQADLVFVADRGWAWGAVPSCPSCGVVLAA